MKHIKRWLCLFLSVLFVIMIFTSCKKDNETDDSTDSMSESDETPNEHTDIKIAENGTVYFKIVYPNDTTDDIKESISSLRQALINRSNNGSVFAFESDASSYDADAFEILVGDTSYPESNKVMESIGYGDWTVRFEGNKLVVTGYSRQAIRTAITKTIQTIKSCADDAGNIAFASDLNLVGTQDEIINDLPRYTSESSRLPKTINEGNDTSLALFERSTVDEYEAYLAKIENEGYTLHTSNVIGENKFFTYANDTHVIHAGWYAYENATRVTIEKKTALVGLKGDNVWSTVQGITTSLAQIGLSNTENNNEDGGMGYIYQLADGSFIVIDGGFHENAEQLYNYMNAKAPNGKIVIAAWFITHDDADHFQAFQSFVGKYGKDVAFEYVVLNFPSSFLASEAKFELEMATYSAASSLSNCKVIKAHTGMKFFLRNAEVEILYTIDSRLPEPLVMSNSVSLVFTVTVEGVRTLFTGDMPEYPTTILMSMYGDYLKSDFLQIAHHGITNGSGDKMPKLCEFYELVCPEVVLWPCAEHRYLNMDGKKSVADYVFNKAAIENARETWVAGDEKITVFELPYSIFSAYQFDINDPHPTPVVKNEALDSARLPHREAVSESVISRVSWNDITNK